MALDLGLVRRTILLIHEPGPLSEQAIRTIVAEAERYAAEKHGIPSRSHNDAVAEAKEELRKTLGIVRRKS